MKHTAKILLSALVLSVFLASSAFSSAPENYNLIITKNGNTITITNSNNFTVTNLTLSVGGKDTLINSIPAKASWRTGDNPGKKYADFVPVGYYQGKENTNPGYDGHCAVVADEPRDWTRTLTCEIDGEKISLTFKTLGPRILFVGNSQTYFWSSAPYFFRELAQMGGYNAQVAYSLYGGSTLPMIAGMTTMDGRNEQPVDTFQKAKNANEYYDVISYHALTDEPIRNDGKGYLTMFNDFMKAAEILAIQTRSRGARMVFMSTWGYRYGYISDSINLPDNDGPVGTLYDFGGVKLAKTMTRTQMELALRTSYRIAADSVGAGIIPVGEASEYVSENFPELVMYYKDCKHPTNLHDYLTACVYYAAMFGDSPEGLGIPPVFDANNPDAGIITEEAAGIMQKVAAMVVLGTPVP